MIAAVVAGLTIAAANVYLIRRMMAPPPTKRSRSSYIENRPWPKAEGPDNWLAGGKPCVHYEWDDPRVFYKKDAPERPGCLADECEGIVHAVMCDCEMLSIHSYCELHLRENGWEQSEGGCWSHPDNDVAIARLGWDTDSDAAQLIIHRLGSAVAIDGTGPNGGPLYEVTWFTSMHDPYPVNTGTSRDEIMSKIAASLPGYVGSRDGETTATTSHRVYKISSRIETYEDAGLSIKAAKIE